MMNETGNYPGQPWMWLYTFWYQIKPFSTSDNADALVWGLMVVLTALFVFVPFIPGLRSVPALDQAVQACLATALIVTRRAGLRGTVLPTLTQRWQHRNPRERACSGHARATRPSAPDTATTASFTINVTRYAPWS